jgi:hypothetical protein
MGMRSATVRPASGLSIRRLLAGRSHSGRLSCPDEICHIPAAVWIIHSPAADWQNSSPISPGGMGAMDRYAGWTCWSFVLPALVGLSPNYCLPVALLCLLYSLRRGMIEPDGDEFCRIVGALCIAQLVVQSVVA